MLSLKKNRPLIGDYDGEENSPEDSPGPDRTHNIRRELDWAARVLLDINEEPTEEYDELDQQDHSFFNCKLPKPVPGSFSGLEEILPQTQMELFPVMGNNLSTAPLPLYFFSTQKKCVDSKATINPVTKAKSSSSIIELSDDDGEEDTNDDEIVVVGEVKASSNELLIKQRRFNEGLEQFNGYVANNGGESLLKCVEKKENQCTPNNYGTVEKLSKVILPVKSKRRRRKKNLVLRNSDAKLDDHLMKPSVIEKRKEKSKKKKKPHRSGKNKQSRAASPGIVAADEFTSDDHIPLIKKKPVQKKKKKSPIASKKAPIGKQKKGEDLPSMMVLPKSEVFAPKKENKLRTVNLNDLMRRSDMVKEHKRLEMKKKEVIKKKEGEILILNSSKFKIPRKPGLPPIAHPIPPPEPVEPVKKKMKVTPIEPARDILGTITDAMDATNVDTAKGHTDPEARSPNANDVAEWVLPSYIEEPMKKPNLPPRFGSQSRREEKEREDEIISPDVTPESAASGSSVKEDGMEQIGKERLDDRESHSNTDNSKRGQSKNEVKMVPIPAVVRVEIDEDRQRKRRYKLYEVDGKKHYPAPPPLVDRHFRKEPRHIPLERDESRVQCDPRVPAPSPNTMSKWNLMGAVINLDEKVIGDGGFIKKIRKEKEGGPSNEKEGGKKKGVKWGETETKEFNVDDDDDMVRVVERDQPNETEIIGEKEVGGKKYKIVKMKVIDPVVALPTKSCLKPVSATLSTTIHPSTVSAAHAAPRPTTPAAATTARDPAVPAANMLPVNKNIAAPKALPSSPKPPTVDIPNRILPAQNVHVQIGGRGTTPTLPDFIPPPGYEVKNKETMLKEVEKRREEIEKRRKAKEKGKEWGTSAEVICVTEESRSKMGDPGGSIPGSEGAAIPPPPILPWPYRLEGSNSSSSLTSMGRMGGGQKGMGAAPSSSMVTIQHRSTPVNPFERGSINIGNTSKMRVYKKSDPRVKKQLGLRRKICRTLNVHRTLQKNTNSEYGVTRGSPTCAQQLREAEKSYGRLTETEKKWLADRIQNHFLSSQQAAIEWPFRLHDGLYWPVVQATDGISGKEEDFESLDVLRALGNHTHFATEKKALLGLESRLPNGQTHKERFESFFNAGKMIKSEGRFKRRCMFVREFNTQNADEARKAQENRIELMRRNLNEHEMNLRKNAPGHVEIVECRVMDRVAFSSFNEGIDYYKDDEYEMERNEVRKWPDWYCTRSDMYFPYSDRAGYLCKVINEYNKDYNKLYLDTRNMKDPVDRRQRLMTLDKAAFAAAQVYLGRMEGWKRVGISKEKYEKLLVRKLERERHIQSNSFSLKTYSALCKLDPNEFSSFHVINDWISSIFQCILPISQLKLEPIVNAAFREVILLIDEKDKWGNPLDKRMIFHDAFQDAMDDATREKRDCKRARMDYGGGGGVY